MAAVCQILITKAELEEIAKIAPPAGPWSLEEIHTETDEDGHERLTLIYKKEVPHAR